MKFYKIITERTTKIILNIIIIKVKVISLVDICINGYKCKIRRERDQSFAIRIVICYSDANYYFCSHFLRK